MNIISLLWEEVRAPCSSSTRENRKWWRLVSHFIEEKNTDPGVFLSIESKCVRFDVLIRITTGYCGTVIDNVKIINLLYFTNLVYFYFAFWECVTVSCAGNVGPEQQSTEDVLDFLSQSSDMEDFGSVHSEPEAETHIMSCYHGIYANGAVRQCEMSSTEQLAKTSKYVFLS